ncbi:MAG: radical SAM protein [Candidatus Portnoybacteria bacterium]|nr:radical SAM protein [Candidatus Portnoybacteria bacterium]
MVKVFLIEPPISVREYQKDHETKYTIWSPPLWGLALSSFLKRHIPKVYIKLLDGQLKSFSEIKHQILEEVPDIVGISPKQKNYERVLKLARIAKKAGVKIVIGGPYADSLAKEIIQKRGPHSSDYCIDAVVKGDGEKAFFEYIAGKPLEKINNLVYQGNYGIKENYKELLDLKKLPPLDFGLVDLNDYIHDYQRRYPHLQERRILRIYTQKGCYWRKINKKGCIFCSLSSGPIRTRDTRIIWNELNGVIDKYGINSVKDISDQALEDKKWFDDFYRGAKTNSYTLPNFSLTLKAGFFDEIIVKKMSEININYVTLGVESASRKILERINTGTTPPLILKAIKMLAKYGIKMSLRFLVGAPGESKETLNTTINFAKMVSRIKEVDRFVANGFVPIPNSPSWDLFLSKTGDKYKNKDILDPIQLQLDWIKYFCAVSEKILAHTANAINQIK